MKAKRTFWDRFAFAYDMAEALNKRVYQTMLDKVVSSVARGASVLECAAGTGAVSIAVAPKAKDVLCTDMSLPMLDRAKAKSAKAGLGNISFAARDLTRLPDRDKSYDAVIAANVVHLLDDPRQALRELWRVTGTGGRLIVPTFLSKGSGKGFSFLIGLYKLIGFRPKHEYTEAAYRRMLSESGLPEPQIEIIRGRVPVGFAVFERNAEQTSL